jgi:hypothetical protein
MVGGIAQETWPLQILIDESFNSLQILPPFRSSLALSRLSMYIHVQKL